MFPLNSVGIVTSRDDFVIDFDKETLKRRIRMFRDEKMPDEFVRQTFNLKDKSNWKLKDAREKIKKDENWEEAIIQILYRPFDVRWIFYHDEVIERSRKEVMRHMMHENLSLCFMRQVSLNEDYSHVLVNKHILDNRTFLSSKGIIQLAPLYLYPEKNNPGKRSPGGLMMLFEPQADYAASKPNLSPALIEELKKYFKKPPSPEQIFFYIYAVLYSNTYRTKYAEFLKIDFPRIPFTKHHKLFIKMGEHGKRLVDLHLLNAPELDRPVTKFQGKGTDKVEKVKYENGRVYINSAQYFEEIKPEVWESQIGGYQICEKWLKDKKGRPLSLDDIKTYCKIVTALQKTIAIQKAIDDIYPKVEKETLEFENL